MRRLPRLTSGVQPAAGDPTGTLALTVVVTALPLTVRAGAFRL